MKRRVAVTGLGVISPVGNDVTSFWTSLKEGRSGAGPITRFDASRTDAKIAAEVKNFDPTLYMDKKDARKMANFTQFAVAAAVQAWRDAGLGEGFVSPAAAEGEAANAPAPAAADATGSAIPYSPERVATIMGIGIGGIEIMMESHKKMLESGPSRMPPMTVPQMISNEGTANIAMRLGLLGPAYTAVTACTSGTDAIGQALDMIRSGRCDAVVAGGAEASITEFAIGAFCRLQALSTGYNDRPELASRPFDKDRDGFLMGEGAAVLILEDWDKALARGARIYAELAGYGASCDAYHLTSPDPSGKGGARAIALALEDAGMRAEEIAYYNAHGTSTQVNDPTETLMVKHAFGDHAKKLAISSTKSMTGHMLGAAGAIEALACVKAIVEGFAPPTINLDHPDIEAGCDLDYVPNVGRAMKIDATASASLGFGGHNGVIIFRSPKWSAAAAAAAKAPIDPTDPRKEIKEYLPHREPFLFVDKVEIEGGKIVAERTYPESEWFFAGHFPGNPVVPGVILVETMAQCGGVGIRKMGIQNAGTFLFAKIREARFRRPVRPGERLDMVIENVKASPRIVHQRGVGSVDGEIAVEAEWIAIVGAES